MFSIPTRTLALLAAAVLTATVLTATAAQAEYTRAQYPQQSPSVSSIQIGSPRSASLGKSFSVALTVDLAAAISEPRPAYIYLNRDGATWVAHVVPPREWKAGPNQVRDITVDVPDNISPGDYQVVAGVYQEPTEGTASIRINGRQPSRLGKIVTRGRMVDKYGVPHEWHINHAHTLIWNGEPWLPAGGMFVYNRDWDIVKAQIDLLKRYGVNDIYLHLGVNQPYPWKTYSDDDYAFFQKTIDYLDDNGFTYGVEFQALEAKGSGYYYPGRGPRVEITSSGTVTAEEDKTLDGNFVVVDRKTGNVVQTGQARVTDRKHLEADVEVPGEGDYRVHFVLHREGPDNYSMYYWDHKYPEYVDVMRRHYSKVALGPGFRFLVDPLWNEMNVNRDFFPKSPIYSGQFQEWLQERYGTIENLNQKWRVEWGPIASFEQAARLAPVDRMRSPDEKIEYQYVLDPETEKVFRMDLAVSQFNYDSQEFQGRSLLHFTSDIADQFKKLYDVPVIYKGFSDMDFWHINDLGGPGGHDGLGMESYGNGEPLMMFMSAHLYGELEQATKTTWLIVTETGEGNHQDNSPSRNKLPGYSSRMGHMYANYNALLTGGAKGFYQFNMIPGPGSNDPWTDALISDPRQLEWLATYDRMLAGASPLLVDWKPPMYFRFPGLYNPNSMNLYSEPAHDYCSIGGWWWREPVERSQNDLWIVPTFSLRPDAPMFIVNLENMPATERHREELVKALKDGVRITMIGHRRDLGAIPEIDRYFTDEYAEDADGREFQVLKPGMGKVLDRAADGKIWNIRDGNLQIVSKEVFCLHGYSPGHLDVGDEQSIEAYYGVFDELLDVDLLPVDDGLYAMHYTDEDGTPVTVIGLEGNSGSRVLSFPLVPFTRVSAEYPNGDKAGRLHAGRLVVDLEPVKPELVKYDQWPDRDQHRWIRNGVLIPSTDARDTVTIRGLPLANSMPVEAAGAVLQQVRTEAADLPEPQKQELLAIVEKARDKASAGDLIGAARQVRREADEFFARQTPYIWIEAEDRVESNFNYSRLGGVLRLSGGAFLGLETEVEPPADTGWFARYDLQAPEDGEYQLWVRENYLAISSPTSFRVDDGEWQHVTNQMMPRDTRVVSLYNAVEDTRQVFAWYHYGSVNLKKGKHSLTIRVNEKRPKGMAVTMADDRPYAKMMDVILLTQGGFRPRGPEPPRYLEPTVRDAMVNLAPSPSFEFRPDGDMKEPRGWIKSESIDEIIWQDAGWGTYNVMPGVAMDLGQRYAYVGQRNLAIRPGDSQRTWMSDIIGVEGEQLYYFEVYVRTANEFDGVASAELKWLNEQAREIDRTPMGQVAGDQDWKRLGFSMIKAPPGAVQVQILLHASAGSKGVVYFDDVVFSRETTLRQGGETASAN